MVLIETDLSYLAITNGILVSSISGQGFPLRGDEYYVHHLEGHGNRREQTTIYPLSVKAFEYLFLFYGICSSLWEMHWRTLYHFYGAVLFTCLNGGPVANRCWTRQFVGVTGRAKS